MLCQCQVLEESFRPDTVLVSIMTVNNEIGVKQPIEEIGLYHFNYCRMSIIGKRKEQLFWSTTVEWKLIPFWRFDLVKVKPN